MKTLLRALTALLGPLAVLLLAATPVGAHGGEGEAEITSVTRDGDDVIVVAHVQYVEDGHGVPDATVTVVVDDGTPVPMEPDTEEGDYTATVAAPEGATIRVTSVEPATTAEAVAPGADQPAGDPADPTTASAPETTSPETTTGAAAGDDASAGTTPTPVPDDDASDDGGGGISPIVIAAIVALVLAGVVTAVILLGKKPSADDGPEAGT